MKKVPNRFITLSGAQWIYVATIALLLIPLTITNLWPYEIYNLYFRTFESPRVQTEFGFSMDRKRMNFHAQSFEVFVITSIEPTGVLARAGVQPNSIALGTFPKNDVAFCKYLLRSHNQDIEIHLINDNEYQELLRNGELSTGERGYKVTVPRQNLY